MDGSEGVPRFPSGEIVPFFTKLTDDPALQGCCNYFLSNPIVRMGSSEKVCDIVLRGVGIRPVMCEVRYNPGGKVNVAILRGGRLHNEVSHEDEDESDDPRVLVNGQPLPVGPLWTMEHADCIILGYAHAFRLVSPGAVSDLSADASFVARTTVISLDMASAVADIVEETGGQFKEVYPYLQQLSVRAPESTVQELLRSLHCVCPLVDEANLLTKEVFGEDKLRFALDVLTDLFDFERDVPRLVICVLSLHRGQPPAAGRERRRSSLVPSAKFTMVQSMGLRQHMMMGEQDPLLYVWSLEKFLRRLNAMRDVYQEGSELKDSFVSTRKQLRGKPHLNPWREMAFADVKFLAEELHDAQRNQTPGQATPCDTPATVREAMPDAPPTQREVTEVREVPRPIARTPVMESASATLRDVSPASSSVYIGRCRTPPHLTSPQSDSRHWATFAASSSVPCMGTVGSAVHRSNSLTASLMNTTVSRQPDDNDALGSDLKLADLDKLRRDLMLCRQDPNCMSGSFSKLLDRFEGLLNNLAPSTARVASRSVLVHEPLVYSIQPKPSPSRVWRDPRAAHPEGVATARAYCQRVPNQVQRVPACRSPHGLVVRS